MKGDAWGHLGMAWLWKTGCLWCLTLGLRSNLRGPEEAAGPQAMVKQNVQQVDPVPLNASHDSYAKPSSVGDTRD